MMGVVTTCAALSFALLVCITIRLHRIRRLGVVLDPLPNPPPPPSDAPRVSIVVPARNEERDLGPCLRSLCAQDWPRTDLVVVDDCSEDRTLEVAREVLAGRAGTRVIAGAPRPSDGWIGKSWALTQGVRDARGDWLLFSDADIVYHPQALSRAMGEVRARGLDALSIIPMIECRSVWEKMIMPLFAMLFMLLEPLGRTRRSGAKEGRLCGAFILVRRTVYEAAGGHEAVRSDILDDLALARRLRESGGATQLVRTHALSSTRMYDRFRDAWQGLMRLGFPMIRYSPALLLAAFAAAFLGAIVPWLALAYGAWAGGAPGWTLTAAGGALILLQVRALEDCCGFLRVRRMWALSLPVAATLTWVATAWSAWCRYSGRGVGWKNRRYRGPGR